MPAPAADDDFHLTALGRVHLRVAEDGAYISDMAIFNDGERNDGPVDSVVDITSCTTPAEMATLATDLANDLAACAPTLQRLFSAVASTGAPPDALAYPDAAFHATERMQLRHAWTAKLARWQRFHAANYSRGVGLARIDMDNGVNLAMLVHAQIARLRCVVALGEMAALRRDGSDVLRAPPPAAASGDSVDEGPAVSRPPWWLDPADSVVLRCDEIAAASNDSEDDSDDSRWRTHAVTLTRDMPDLCARDLVHLPASTTPYMQTPLLTFTARQLAETLIYLTQNAHLFARSATPLADVEMRALVGALTLRADLLLCGSWPASVLDVPEFRTDEGGPEPSRTGSLYSPSDAMLAFLCVMLHALHSTHGASDRHLLPHGAATECRRFAGGARWGAAAGLAVRTRLYASLAGSRDAVETFADALVTDWAADALAPGVAQWDNFERRRLPSNDLARYWIEQTNIRERALRLLKKFQPQHGEFVEWYLLRLQNALASYTPARLFATFIDRLLAGDPLDAEDFERHVVRALPDAAAVDLGAVSEASSLFPQGRAAALQMEGRRAQQGQYVDIVTRLRNRILLSGMNMLVEAEGGGSRWIEDHTIAQSELQQWTPEALWQRSHAHPLIVQLGPLRHDVLFRGVLCHCGHDMRATLAAWIDAATRAKLDDRLAAAVERIAESVRAHCSDAVDTTSEPVETTAIARGPDRLLPSADVPLGYRLVIGERTPDRGTDTSDNDDEDNDAELYVNFEDLLNSDRSEAASTMAGHVVSMLGNQSRFITYSDEDASSSVGDGGNNSSNSANSSNSSSGMNSDDATAPDDPGDAVGHSAATRNHIGSAARRNAIDRPSPTRHQSLSLAQRLAARVTQQTPMPPLPAVEATPEDMSPAVREHWEQQKQRWGWLA